MRLEQGQVFEGGGVEDDLGAGTLEGVVSSLGLLYTTFAHGEDQIMVPNSVVLSVAVVPLRQPAALDLRASLLPGTTPAHVQRLLDEHLDVPLRDRAVVGLEAIDRHEVVLRITVVPENPGDGPHLAPQGTAPAPRSDPARKPACGACPIAPLCPAYGEGETDPEKAGKLLKYEKGGFPGQRLNPPQAYLDAGGKAAPPLGAG